MSRTIITSGGLSGIAGSGGSGPYFAIKYFTPVYDYRMDANIAVSPLAFENTVTCADTIPVGEQIFNLSGSYELTESEILISAGTETISGGSVVLNNNQNNTGFINLYKNTPISNAISGTTFTYNAPSATAWTVTNYLSVSGSSEINKTVMYQDTALLYDVAAYTPITINGSTTRGLFKCRLGTGVGNYKFNKVVLYAVSLDSAGTVNGTPFLFAIAGLRDTVRKSSTPEGISEIEVDVELEFSINNEFDNVSFVGDDYWTRVAGSSGVNSKLTYDGDVSIASSGIGAIPRDSKLNITTQDGKQHIRLSLDDTGTKDFNIGLNTNADLILSGSNVRTSANHIISGDISLGSFNGVVSPVSRVISMENTPPSCSGDGADLTISGSSATGAIGSATGGKLILKAGEALGTGVDGIIELIGKNVDIKVGSNATPGNLNIGAGATYTNSKINISGNINLGSHNGTGTKVSRVISMENTPPAFSGDGANLTISGSSATGGSGSATGGKLILRAGVALGSGVDGDIDLYGRNLNFTSEIGSGIATINGGMNVTTNLTVSGSLLINNGMKIGGPETLKIYTYTHQVTNTDILAGYADITVASITATKIRALTSCYYSPINVSVIGQTGNNTSAGWSRIMYLPTPVTCRVYFDTSIAVALTDYISIQIVAAV